MNMGGSRARYIKRVWRLKDRGTAVKPVLPVGGREVTNRSQMNVALLKVYLPSFRVCSRSRGLKTMNHGLLWPGPWGRD